MATRKELPFIPLGFSPHDAQWWAAHWSTVATQEQTVHAEVRRLFEALSDDDFAPINTSAIVTMIAPHAVGSLRETISKLVTLGASRALKAYARKEGPQAMVRGNPVKTWLWHLPQHWSQGAASLADSI
jgi:hypothetical protein